MGRKDKKEVLEDLQEKYKAQDSAENGRQYFEAERKVMLEDANKKGMKSENGKMDCLSEICCDCCCDEGCGCLGDIICNH